MGNKSDKCQENPDLREVSESDIEKFSEEYKIKVYECSAKEGKNVDSTFI